MHLRLMKTGKDLSEKIKSRVLSKHLMSGSRFSIAISGGNSPIALYKLWRDVYKDDSFWALIDFYWVDERCVSPDSSESNYGTFLREFFNYMEISSTQIFQIDGNHTPHLESSRYSNLIKNIGGFDLMILGIGEDGHTSSLFPESVKNGQIENNNLYDVYQNPYNGSIRVGATYKTILSANEICFYLIGAEKHKIIESVQNDFSSTLPASYVLNHHAKAEIFFDE